MRCSSLILDLTNGIKVVIFERKKGLHASSECQYSPLEGITSILNSISTCIGLYWSQRTQGQKFGKLEISPLSHIDLYWKNLASFKTEKNIENISIILCKDIDNFLINTNCLGTCFAAELKGL